LRCEGYQRSLITPLFSSARQVLDYSHCSDYLHRMAKAQYGDSPQAHEWVEATLTRLYLGKISAVLGGLKRMQVIMKWTRPCADRL
jgi:hypothetical protein